RTGDEGAPFRVVLDDPVGGESDQRPAHRLPVHTEHLAQLDLSQLRARSDPVQQDGVPDAEVDLVTGQVPAVPGPGIGRAHLSPRSAVDRRAARWRRPISAFGTRYCDALRRSTSGPVLLTVVAVLLTRFC